MRITHVISDTGIGGAGRYLLSLLPGGERHGWEQTVYVPEGPLAEALRADGLCKVIPMPWGERSFSLSLWRWLARNLQPTDLVHTHASLAARLIAKSRCTPVVLTRHTLGAALPPGGLPAWKRRLHGFVAETWSDATIAVSEACRQRLLAEGVAEDSIRLIYHGIDTAPYLAAQGSAPQADGDTKQGPTIITVARLTPVKGLLHALEAAALLQQAGRNFTWVFVGDGPQAEELRQRAKALGLEKRVHWLGFREDIPALLAASQIFALPSLEEALGLALLEAMASGLPVVASQVGGIPELVQDEEQGLLVPPAAPQELAQALLRLLDDPALAARLGEAGQARLLANFTAQKMWRETDALYREVLSRGGKA